MVLAGGGLNRLKAYRLTPNSPSSWEDLGIVASGTAYQSPRIDVNPNSSDPNGTVYLTWLDWNSNTIYAMSSSTQGSSWSQPASFTAGTLLGPSSDTVCSNSSAYKCIEARSMTATRFNATTNALEMVYHQRIGSDGAQVFHNRFQSGTWGMPEAVSTNSGTHYSWNGALDCTNTDGTCLVTFYDSDPADFNHTTYEGIRYRLTSRMMYATPSQDDVILYNSATAADPFPAMTWMGDFVLGEYQDVWYFNNAWTAATIYIDSSTNKNDVFVAKK